MNSREQITEFIHRLENLPSLNDDQLLELMAEMRLCIRSTFGEDSQYLDYLKFIKFHPASRQATVAEVSRCWDAGVSQVANVLQVMLHDPLIAEVKPKPRFNHLDNDVSLIGGDAMQKGNPSSRLTDLVQKSMDAVKETLGWENNYDDNSSQGAVANRTGISGHRAKRKPMVFLVGGPDEVVNNEIADYFRNLGLDVAIKTEDLHIGSSIIDQVKQFSIFDFACVVLPGDHYLYLQGKMDQSKIVAAQHTAFELGYLVGRLGRARVVGVYQEADYLTRPTDFFDVFYVAFSVDGFWKSEITKRLCDCGLPIRE